MGLAVGRWRRLAWYMHVLKSNIGRLPSVIKWVELLVVRGGRGQEISFYLKIVSRIPFKVLEI